MEIYKWYVAHRVKDRFALLTTFFLKKNELEIGVSWGTDVENNLFCRKLVLVDFKQQLGYDKLHERVTDRELVSALDMYQRCQRERENTWACSIQASLDCLHCDDLSGQQSPSAREVAERNSCQEWKQNKGYLRGTEEEEISMKMEEKPQDRLSSIIRRILKGKLCIDCSRVTFKGIYRLCWQTELACDFWWKDTLKSAICFDHVDYKYFGEILLCFNYLFLGRDGSSDFGFKLIHFLEKLYRHLLLWSKKPNGRLFS